MEVGAAAMRATAVVLVAAEPAGQGANFGFKTILNNYFIWC